MGFLLHDGVRAEFIQARERLGGSQAAVIMIAEHWSRRLASPTGSGVGHCSMG